MINLQMFDTEEDLMKLTGLSHDELWDNDFDLDDWDVGFVSDVPLPKHSHSRMRDMQAGRRWIRALTMPACRLPDGGDGMKVKLDHGAYMPDGKQYIQLPPDQLKVTLRWMGIDY